VTKELIRFKFAPLDGVADKLERVAARGRFALAAADAVNTVTKRATEALMRGEMRDINLSPAYIKSKTDMALAQPGGKPRAEIITKGDTTTMGRFGVDMTSMRRGGNPVLRAGVRHGRRNSGTYFQIKKSAAAFEPQWFVLPLKGAGGGGGLNGFGVFVRDDRLKPGANAVRPGKAGKRHIYGPSPYQLFKEQIRLQSDDIRADLQRTALAIMGDEIEDALA
jgi:hypothetical protein